MLLTLEVQPGRGLVYFTLGTALSTFLDSWSSSILSLYPSPHHVPPNALFHYLLREHRWHSFIGLRFSRAGMSLFDAVNLIRKRRSDLSCVEVKYANQVLLSKPYCRSFWLAPV